MMKTNGRTWAPTLTLAKLFEEQNQFFDALAAYELISQTDDSPAVRERIEDLHVRILNDPANRYDPRIEQLFTPEELAYLKILSHNGFENLAQARAKLAEGSFVQEIVIDDDEEEETLPEPSDGDAMLSVLREIEEQSREHKPDPAKTPEELSLADFLLALLSRYSKDTPLSELRFTDFLSIFLELQTRK